MSADTVALGAIRVEDRARRTMTGIDALAASIETVGLLHPIVVTADLRLVAGGRRLEAVRALGWERVPVTVVTNLTEAAAILQAESDENTEREPLKPTEAADLAAKIENVLKPLADQRKKAGKAPSANLAEGSAPRPREAAAKATGFGAETIRKTRTMQKVATDETLPEQVQDIAKAALSEADLTGKVDPSYKRVTEAVAAATAATDFPDLQYYIDKGEPGRAVQLAAALRGYDGPELTMRLNNLRLSIDADKRRSVRPVTNDAPDFVKLADAIFVAVNNALQVIEKNGGADTIREAMTSANPLAVEIWRDNFTRIASTATDLESATRPTLRRVK